MRGEKSGPYSGDACCMWCEVRGMWYGVLLVGCVLDPVCGVLVCDVCVLSIHILCAMCCAVRLWLCGGCDLWPGRGCSVRCVVFVCQCPDRVRSTVSR